MENTKSQKKSYSTASSKSRARRKTKTDYYDYSLVAVIVLLTCFGLIMLYSTSSYMAQINYGSDMYFFKKAGHHQRGMYYHGTDHFQAQLSDTEPF